MVKILKINQISQLGKTASYKYLSVGYSGKKVTDGKLIIKLIETAETLTTYLLNKVEIDNIKKDISALGYPPERRTGENLEIIKEIYQQASVPLNMIPINTGANVFII